MGERLPEELIEKMMPVLREMAELIGDGGNPDQDVLKGILSRVGLGEDKRALDEFAQWCETLGKVNSVPKRADQREEIVAALQERGISEAAATLAVERATEKPLTSEPDAIDFGLLKPGEAANRTLKVNRSLISAESPDKRLNVTCLRSGPTETLVKIMLKAGKSGESLNNEVVLQGRGVEIRVPVTARWAAKKDEPRGPQPLRVCPTCKDLGVHGEGSLFYNWIAKTWGCLNPKCPDFYKKE